MTVGIQKHVAASAKHYMAYDIEKAASQRLDWTNRRCARRYGRHFRMIVQDGGVASVMASYN